QHRHLARITVEVALVHRDGVDERRHLVLREQRLGQRGGGRTVGRPGRGSVGRPVAPTGGQAGQLLQVVDEPSGRRHDELLIDTRAASIAASSAGDRNRSTSLITTTPSPSTTKLLAPSSSGARFSR